MLLQTATDPALLARIVANVAEYRAKLPSITAEETIKSDLSQGGFYQKHDTATATIRVYAASEGSQVNEVRTYLTLNGKPVKTDRKVQVTFEMNAAFSHTAELYFSPARLACVDFKTLPTAGADGSISIAFTSKLDAPPACNFKGVVFHGSVLVDPATSQIRHLERTITRPADDAKRTLTFTSLDCAPTLIGNETFWLPTHVQVELDGGRGHFEAHYAHYHRYAGSLTIVPSNPAPGAIPDATAP